MGLWICRPKWSVPEHVLSYAFPYGNRYGILIEADSPDAVMQKLGGWWQQCVNEGWAEIVPDEEQS